MVYAMSIRGKARSSWKLYGNFPSWERLDMPLIFISYRRQDARGDAGRLADDLQEAFGEEQVFRDIDAIEAGVDFVQAIDEAVGSSKCCSR